MVIEALMFTGPIAGVGAIVWAHVDRRFRVVYGSVCGKCGYSLAGLTSESPCPECGATAAGVRRRPPMTRAHRRAIMWGCVYAVVATSIATLAAVAALKPLDVFGVAFAASFLGSPFVVLACGPLVLGARVHAGVGHVMAAAGMLVCLTIEVWGLVMTATGPPDAQAGLVVIAAPVAGGLASGHGMVVGALLAAVRSRRLDSLIWTV